MRSTTGLAGVANWLVLAAALISAGNAMSRYAFDLSSNAWLEIQWYLFAAIVMFGASLTLKMNEHVRVDIIYTHLSERGKEWLDLVGTRVFLVPSMLTIAWYSLPFFLQCGRCRRSRATRRAHPLAGEDPGAARLHAGGAAGHLGDHQARASLRGDERYVTTTRGRCSDPAGVMPPSCSAG
jgi:hypothetical protein